MKKFSIKTALGITAIVIGFVSTSANAMPISYYSPGSSSSLNPFHNTEEKSPVVKTYTEQKIKNNTLESLAVSLKNTSVKKDDLIIVLGLVSNYLYNSINASNESTQEKAVNSPVKTSQVPEPTSILLLGLGMLGIVGLRNKKV